jgi:hypothetical protein
LLHFSSAAAAADHAVRELESGKYAGANFLCADQHHAFVVQFAEALQVNELSPGLHLMTNWALDDRTDDRQLLARYLFAARFPHSVDSFLERSAEICRQGPDAQGRFGIVLRGADRGTVSSTILALTRDPQRAVLWYADGAPDEVGYQDLSAALRELLSESQLTRSA